LKVAILKMANEEPEFKALNTGKILNAFYFPFHMQKYVIVIGFT
jgi:hypothetical protein